MDRKTFDQHQVWKTTVNLLSLTEDITPSDASETGKLERIQFILNVVLTHRNMASTHAAFFNDAMLSAPVGSLAETKRYLDARLSAFSESYTPTALSHAEKLLIDIAIWPRPYGKGAQVNQMNTLFEDLLDRQERHLSDQEMRQKEILVQLQTFDVDTTQRYDAAVQQLASTERIATAAAQAVETEKARVDKVIKDGMQAINDMDKTNSTEYGNWVERTEQDWVKRAAEIQERMENAEVEAASSLTSLQETEVGFANLTSAAAAGKLAEHFADEAVRRRKSSNILLSIGFGFLVAAAVPLVLVLVFSGGDSNLSWQTISVRLSIAVVFGTAATVALKLGSKFAEESTASKRMEMELRTFGPFLSAVGDQSEVDKARLELIDRAFGKSYANQKPGGGSTNEELVPISGVNILLETILKGTHRT